MNEHAAGTDSLKAFVSELLAAVTLPALWRGAEPPQLAQILVDALLAMLRLDLVYVRIAAGEGLAPVEVARSASPSGEPTSAASLGQRLDAWLGSDPRRWPPLAHWTQAGTELHVVVYPLGWQGDGVIVAGAARSGFPTQTEKLLLNVTANQAAMGLQEARILGVQKRVAEELDRRVAERTAELQRSEALLAETQRLSGTGSFTWREDTGAMTWSEQTYRIFGMPPSTPVAMSLLETCVRPDDASSFQQRLRGAQTSETGVDFEAQLQVFGAPLRYVHVVARRLRNAGGGLEFTGSIQDITERRLAQESLARASAELAHVARITTLGVLAASIAHEVNQPLAGVLTNADTCLRMLAHDPPNTVGATIAAQRLLRDGSRAAEVVRRLRALFGRKTAALSELVDLNDAMKEVVALSSMEIQRRRVLMRMELAPYLPAVRGDRVQLQQVMLNLVRNACDAMSAVQDRPRDLLVRTELPGDGCVRLLVRDSGEGLGEQPAERLFQAFFTTKAEGMGIGLSVSRSIIEHHSGRLWARNNEGPGATFCFAIPIALPAETLPATAPTTA